MLGFSFLRNGQANNPTTTNLFRILLLRLHIKICDSTPTPQQFRQRRKTDLFDCICAGMKAIVAAKFLLNYEVKRFFKINSAVLQIKYIKAQKKSTILLNFMQNTLF